MTENADLAMENPEAFGIQDPESPGEPDYWAHKPSVPVPGTAAKTRDEELGRRSGQHNETEGEGHTTSRGGRGGHGGRH